MVNWYVDQEKTSKYHAKKTEVNGITFDSKKEARYYELLLLLEAEGTVTRIELQPEFVLQPAYKKKGKTVRAIIYRADFKVTYNDGHTEIVDVKGMRTDVYKLKKKMLEYRYPGIELVEV